MRLSPRLWKRRVFINVSLRCSLRVHGRLCCSASSWTFRAPCGTVGKGPGPGRVSSESTFLSSETPAGGSELCRRRPTLARCAWVPAGALPPGFPKAPGSSAVPRGARPVHSGSAACGPVRQPLGRLARKPARPRHEGLSPRLLPRRCVGNAQSFHSHRFKL